MKQYKLTSKSHLTVNFADNGKPVSVLMSTGDVRELPETPFVLRMVENKILVPIVDETPKAKPARAPRASKETSNPQPE